MATAKTRPLARDREYLESQIEQGFTVNVDGVSYNRKNAKDLPTQAELDGETAPAPIKRQDKPGPDTILFGRKLSEYAGKTDPEIDKMTGVKTADVAKIRAALDAAGLK